MSLSPQTLRIQHRLSELTKSGRKHWGLYRWVSNPFILSDAIHLVVRNGGSAGLGGQRVTSLRGREWEVACELSDQLRRHTYQPGAVRRVYIPKQGGPLSPLLANVYIHYALDVKIDSLLHASEGRIQLFRFADDFVVLGVDRDELQEVKWCIEDWLSEAGLSLHPEKTRFVDMRNAHRSHASYFDFLGYRIHLRSFRDNRKRFWIARQPSLKARQALRTTLRDRLYVGLSLSEAARLCLKIWRGWSGYFRYGNSNRILYKERHSVWRAFMRYLRRKYRRQRRPVPSRVLRVLLRRVKDNVRPPAVCPRSSPAEVAATRLGLTLEEPYTGNLDVRFGGGRGRKASPTLYAVLNEHILNSSFPDGDRDEPPLLYSAFFVGAQRP